MPTDEEINWPDHPYWAYSCWDDDFAKLMVEAVSDLVRQEDFFVRNQITIFTEEWLSANLLNHVRLQDRD